MQQKHNISIGVGDCELLRGGGILNSKFDFNKLTLLNIMKHHSSSFKARLSGVFLALVLMVSPMIASADVLSDMAAKLAQASASLNNILTSLSGTQQAQVAGVSYQTDLEIYTGCHRLAATGDCVKADFNSDGYVNTLDLNLLKSALKYDMNADLIIDLRDSADNADLNFIKSCFFQSTASSTPCAKTDFTGDGVVNVADLALFKSAGAKNGVSYDLNTDNKVDLTETVAPTISYVQVPAENINVIHPGEQARIFGNGFSLSSPVAVYIGNYSASGQTTSDGSQVTFMVPNIPAGSYSLSVGDHVFQTNSINITIPSAPLTPTPGNFTVLKDPSSPNFATVAGGSQNVVMGTLALTASSENITLSQIALQLTSGFPSDIIQATLWKGDLKVGTAIFVGSNKYATSTLVVPVAIPQNSTILLTIKVDLSQIGTGYPGTQGAFIKIDYDGDNRVGTFGTGSNSGMRIYSSTTNDTSFDGIRMVEAIIMCPTGQIWDGLKSCVISSPSTTITFPSVGVTLQKGSTYNITWTGSDAGVTNYAVYLVGSSLGSNGSKFLGTAYTSQNSFSWTVPSDVIAGSGYQIQFSGAWTSGDNSDSFSITEQSQPISSKTDLEIYTACHRQTAVGGCLKSDFNSDGYVNTIDLNLLKSALIYDLNTDLIIDLRDTTDNADLNFLKSCFGQYTASSTSCMKSDFDASGFVNFADLGLFKSAGKYDLNADNKVDLRDPSTTCMAGQTWNGSACVVVSTTCPMGQVISGTVCVVATTTTPTCAMGQVWNSNACVIATTETPSCGMGQTWNGSACIIAAPQISVASPMPLIERNLYRGMRGDAVRKLQELLARDPQIYPSGQATGYYGFLTQAAVQNFQCKYGIVCDGDPETTGYGVVGPKTIMKINEIMGSVSGGSTGSGLPAATGTAQAGAITVTPPTSSTTVVDYQKQISALLEQLKMLQAQLNSLPR